MIFRDFIFSFVSLFAVVNFTASLQADEPPSLINKHLERASNQQKYACAIFCESTHIDGKSAKKDSYAEFWYLHSYDPETRARRHDHHRQSAINDVYSASPGIYATLIYENKKAFRQWLNRNTQKRVDIENREDDDVNEEIAKRIYHQTFFDPLTLTFRGSESFNPDSSIALVSDYNIALKKYRCKDEEERGHMTIQGFQPVHPDIYDVIAFDERMDRMPVLLTRTYGKGGKFYESVATSWHKAGDQWYPIVSEFKQILGSSENSRKLKYYWMLDDFPKGIFPEGNEAPLHGSELKEAIVKWSEEKFTKKSEGRSGK